MTGLATTRAIERSGGHLYTVREGSKVLGPFPGATAICALQDSLGGSGGLMTWAVKLALDSIEHHVIADRDGYRFRSSDNGYVDWMSMREHALAAQKGPANLGTAVHATVDQLNKGQTVAMFTDGVAPYVAQYGAALYQKGIRVLASERYAVNTEIGFGCTYDSIVEIDGERGPLDVKTGKEKPSQRLQLTGISMCEWHAEAGLEAEPMPLIGDVGWILLLRPDGYELVRHEITDADREHFIALVDTYHRIRAWAAAFEPTALKEAA